MDGTPYGGLFSVAGGKAGDSVEGGGGENDATVTAPISPRSPPRPEPRGESKDINAADGSGCLLPTPS